MTKVKAQISNEFQMTNAKQICPPINLNTAYTGEDANGKKSKFSISQDCIREIPLNPPLQKGEEVGIPGLIEELRKR